MKYRVLGATGLKVSEIGIGAFPLSGVQARPDGSRHGWTGTDDAESVALIHHAEELGVNVIDTAEGYGSGHSEEVVGKALKGRRDKWVVATKVQPNQGFSADVPDEAGLRRRIQSACEDSLRRMQTEYMDVYQLHAVPHPWAREAVMETLAALKKSGKVRWYGISTNNREAIDDLRRLGPIDVLQIGYNLLERSADPLLTWAKEQEIGTLIRVPLAKGMLTGKYFGSGKDAVPQEDVRHERFNRPESLDAFGKLPQLAFLQTDGRSMVQAALRFVLDHPGVSTVIAGAKTRSQIEENAAASELASLADDELEKALAIANEIKTPGWI